MHVPQIPKPATTPIRHPGIARLMLARLLLIFAAKLALWSARLGFWLREPR